MTHRMPAGPVATVLVVLLAAPGMCDLALAAPATQPAGDGNAVLDNNSLWRCFKAFKFSDVRTADGNLETRSINMYWGNVLAIEVHRAPVHEVIGGKGKGGHQVEPYCAWPPIGLLNARLTASPPGAVTPPARPEGLQVWSCLPSETVSAFDYGDPCEPVRPIALSAARNGVFSGRLMVTSGQPIKGLPPMPIRYSEGVWVTCAHPAPGATAHSSIPSGHRASGMRGGPDSRTARSSPGCVPLRSTGSCSSATAAVPWPRPRAAERRLMVATGASPWYPRRKREWSPGGATDPCGAPPRSVAPPGLRAHLPQSIHPRACARGYNQTPHPGLPAKSAAGECKVRSAQCEVRSLHSATLRTSHFAFRISHSEVRAPRPSRPRP